MGWDSRLGGVQLTYVTMKMLPIHKHKNKFKADKDNGKMKYKQWQTELTALEINYITHWRGWQRQEIAYETLEKQHVEYML